MIFSRGLARLNWSSLFAGVRGLLWKSVGVAVTCTSEKPDLRCYQADLRIISERLYYVRYCQMASQLIGFDHWKGFYISSNKLRNIFMSSKFSQVSVQERNIWYCCNFDVDLVKISQLNRVVRYPFITKYSMALPLFVL